MIADYNSPFKSDSDNRASFLLFNLRQTENPDFSAETYNYIWFCLPGSFVKVIRKFMVKSKVWQGVKYSIDWSLFFFR